MNNNHRENFEELNAERTARVLETGVFETDEENRTAELGRLLRQSVEHDLPKSSESLREQLLAELSGGEMPVAPTKTLATKDEYRVSRKRMWMALPAAVLLMGGGWFVYSDWAVPMAQRNWKAEVLELKDRAEVAEQSFNDVAGGTSNSSLDSKAHPNQLGVELSGGIDLVGDLDFAAEPAPEVFAFMEQGGQQGQQGGQQGQQGGEGFGVPHLPNDSSREGYLHEGRFLSRGELTEAIPENGDPKRRNFSFAINSESDKRQEASNNMFFAGPGARGPTSSPMPRSGRGGGGLGGRGYRADAINGKTIQLPALKSTATNTVVSVPDGETILMGGIKGERIADAMRQAIDRDGDGKSAGEQYAPIHENLFVEATGGSAISTFSIDVDTASYANMRRFLNSGQRPPRNSVRIEELVNYFQYNYPQPTGEDPFSVNMELATCPWNGTHKLLRVGLKGKEIHVQERPATNVVYLIDVSGSMNSPDKLPLLKSGFQMMTKQLGENDRVSIVTYAGSAGVALEPTTGEKTKTIHEAIERLTSGGSTHGSAGIELAYQLAQKHFIKDGVNKVILATDGDLNVGVTNDNSLVKLIQQKASEGVFLTVLGFGTGNLKDAKLEKIADNGNGHYAYIDSNREAHRVLVQQMSGSLVTIAKDVKIQIEFNPAEVSKYRLIGYENRMLATKDFADDRKDAGEIGAGHTVTAIYEIEPTGGVASAFTAPEGMKYQTAEAPKKVATPKKGLTEAAATGELATVALRYKKPDENVSKRIEFTIENEEQSFGSASEDFRFAASVAGFGMLLRGSEYSGDATSQKILQMASDSIGDDPSGCRAEFVDLVRKACYGQ